MRNEIPLARGLGSSAAATVAGLVAGNALLGEPLTHGRPAPARDRDRGPSRQRRGGPARRVHGLRDRDDGIESLRFDAPRDLRAVLFIPELRLATDDMRAALPAKVPLEDAVANLSRVAIGVAGMATGRFDLLRVLTVDRLHEPYRARPTRSCRSSSRPRARPARSGRACRAPARRSSPSPTRSGRSPGSRRRSARPRPTRT